MMTPASYESLLRRTGFEAGKSVRDTGYWSKSLSDRVIMVDCVVRFVSVFKPDNFIAEREVSDFSDSSELELALTYQSLRPLSPPGRAPR